MELKTNMRQIPSASIYTADKKYSDIFYGYLQIMSSYDKKNNIRYFEKKMINFSKLSTILNVNRQVLSTKFQSFIDKGLIAFNEIKQRYELIPLSAELATLLPEETVRVLCNTLRERSLSILAYLINWYYAHDRQVPCDINIDLIKSFLGLNIANRGINNQTIVDTLLVLSKLGFIKYHTESRFDDESKGVKKYYVLDEINNEVRF